MEFAELELTPDHYREGMRRMKRAVLTSGARRQWADQAATFTGFGLLAALTVSGVRAAAQLRSGASGWTAAGYAMRITLLSLGILAVLGLLWFAVREWQARRLFRRMDEGIGGCFDAPLSIRLGWDKDQLVWESEEGIGGMPFSKLHAWDEGSEVLLLYVEPFHFLPVPLPLLEPGQAARLVATLRESGVSREWALPETSPQKADE